MKPDRNAPCPCGSGKKYKKCCIEKEMRGGKGSSPALGELGSIEKAYYVQNEWLEKELAERTTEEVAYDDVLLKAYSEGITIEESIRIANEQYPSKALTYDSTNIVDIENHYDYLATHLKVKKEFNKVNQKLADKHSQSIRLGIAWYDDSKSFLSMREYVSDKENWEETYIEWLNMAFDREEEIKKAGIYPIRVRITTAGLAEYCKENGKTPDSETRAQYISFLLEKM
jgi:hypothetical protein